MKAEKPFQVCVYVEGGGDSRSGDLATECRIGFSALLERATNRKIKVIPCGGRGQAYRAFSIAVGQGKYDMAILLVDSEEVVGSRAPWEHLELRDKWKPLEAPAHLMVVCMEAWLLADHDALSAHFGNAFEAGRIPKWQKLWEVNKDDLNRALENATKDRDRKNGGPYGKGRDSFKILARVDPKKLEACPYAKRLFVELRNQFARSAKDQ